MAVTVRYLDDGTRMTQYLGGNRLSREPNGSTTYQDPCGHGYRTRVVYGDDVTVFVTAEWEQEYCRG